MVSCSDGCGVGVPGSMGRCRKRQPLEVKAEMELARVVARTVAVVAATEKLFFLYLAAQLVQKAFPFV